MKSLTAKEWRQARWIIVLPVVFLSLAWVELFRFTTIWIDPDGEHGMFAALSAMAAGLVLAGWQFAGEAQLGTRTYLLHRGVEPDRVFAAKARIGVLGTFAIGFAPFLSLYVWHQLTAPEAALAQWRRLAELAIASSAALGAYALAAWQFSSNAGRPGELLVRFAIMIGGAFLPYLALVRIVTVPDLIGTPAGWMLLVGGEVVLCALFLGLARRRFRGGADADLPLPRAEAFLSGAALLLALGLPALSLLGLFQNGFRAQISASYPWVVGTVPGDRFWLTEPAELGRGSAGGGAEPGTPAIPVWHPRELQERHRNADRGRYFALEDWKYLAGPRPRWQVAGRDGTYAISAYLIQPAGEIVVFYRPTRTVVLDRNERTEDLKQVELSGQQALLRRFDKGAAGGFSRDTHALEGTGSNRLVIADFDDLTLWGLDPTDLGETLRPVELPGGDRWIGWEHPYDDTLERAKHWNSIAFVVFVGEAGRYVVTERGFEPFDGEARDLMRKPVVPREFELRLVTADDVTPAVAMVHKQTGETLFEHAFEPRTSGERVRLFGSLALSATRLPLAVLLSLGVDGNSFRHAGYPHEELLEPLVFGGRRPWLAGISLAGGAVLAWGAAQRLDRRRETAGRKVAWCVAILLTGLAGFYAFALVERASAYAPRSTPAGGSSREPLICTG